jgi:hypothetical protein
MRQIIEERYGYRREKVFSFANLNDDDLARGDKWGGCCVTWWYHVAPLVRAHPDRPDSIRNRAGHRSQHVHKPVLLSTWLMAQENTACAANAKVSMY